METNTVFQNAGKPWSEEEDLQLNKLYNKDMLDIIEISRIHNRTPGGIISRLIKHNYIPDRISARGYNSDLYKEILKEKRKTETLEIKANQVNQVNQLDIHINTSIENMKHDIEDMKHAIKDMNHEIKEWVAMMKAVYEFQDT